MSARLSRFLRLAFALGLTLWIVWKADPSMVGRALAHTNWSWVLAACALVLADRLLMAYRWIALLAPLGARRPPLATLVRIFFISTFLGTFLVQSVGSDAVRTWSLTRDGVPASQSLASVLMDRLLGVVSILVAAVAGLAFAPDLVSDRTVAWSFVVTGGGCLVALAIIFSTRVDDAIRGTLVRWPAGRIRRGVEGLLDALQAYRAEHRMVGVVLGASVAVQVLRILQAWMLGRSLGLEVPMAAYFAFIPIILLVMLLPISIMGLGVSQVSFAWCFARVGVVPADALALSVLFIALGPIGNLPGGLLYATGSSRGVAARAPNGPPVAP